MRSILISSKNAAKLALITFITSVSAANAIDIPGAADSGQVAKRFERSGSPLATPDLNLPVPADVGELSAAAKKQLEQNKFTLKTVEIDGATIFKNGELEFAYEDKIGKTISLLDAREIAKQITDYYRKKGYILSQAVIPAQDLKGGVLKVRVIEGFVGGVVIEGQKLTKEQNKILQSFANNITKSTPVRTQDLERYLLLMNDLPGAKVNGLLRPSANKFGAAELVLKVGDDAFSGSYQIDNRGSKFIGPWQNSVTGNANSLFGSYDRTQVSLNSSLPFEELLGFDLQHEQFLDSEGTKLAFRYSRTRTEPGDSLKNLQIIGDSNIYELKLTHPFVRSRQENLIAKAMIESRNTDTNVFEDVDFTEDRLRIARIGATYDLLDSYRGNNNFDFQVSQGLNIFNASESGTDRSNAIGESDFTKINFDFSRVQGITNEVSLFAGAASQYSFDPLLVGEQFAIGGAGFGSAYDPAEVLGDSGIAGKLELRHDNFIGAEYLQNIQTYSFYDLGRAWSRNVASSANDKKSLASAGLGVRLSLTDDLSGDAQLALPLTKTPSNQGDRGKDPRVFVGLTARF